MKILFIGDIVGRAGRDFLTHNLNKIRNQYKIDFCIANGENSAHGKSITTDVFFQLSNAGVDFITMGNHTFNRNVEKVFENSDSIIRPANFPNSLPGTGYGVYDTGTAKIGIINVQGRVYMEPLDSPFAACNNIIDKIKGECDAIIVDFHAEATSEKAAMAHYLNGKVSAVIGTHTHVQTADEQILSEGTAFITDVGMTGASDSILGVKKEIIINRFVNHLNDKFEIADGKTQFNAVVITVDEISGKATNIERINLK